LDWFGHRVRDTARSSQVVRQELAQQRQRDMLARCALARPWLSF